MAGIREASGGKVYDRPYLYQYFYLGSNCQSMSLNQYEDNVSVEHAAEN